MGFLPHSDSASSSSSSSSLLSAAFLASSALASSSWRAKMWQVNLCFFLQQPGVIHDQGPSASSTINRETHGDPDEHLKIILHVTVLLSYIAWYMCDPAAGWHIIRLGQGDTCKLGEKHILFLPNNRLEVEHLWAKCSMYAVYVSPFGWCLGYINVDNVW